MVKRWVPQEIAFEYYLRQEGASYIAVDEAKRPISIDKNFDFLVFTPSKVLAVDVKGKQLPYLGKNGGFLWETWIHSNDISGSSQWEEMLKALVRCPVESLLAYAYLINDKSYLKDFQTIYSHKGKKYGIKGIEIRDFEKHKIIRSGFCY